MPKQKDLKRVVRTRMRKTGESYMAARAQMLRTRDGDYEELAGMSGAKVKAKTGRGWAEWVKVLDAARSTEKSHSEIARYVSSLGTPDWWSQTVTVGFERIRGLRDRGQRRGGAYETSKSRTFGVPVSELFAAFADVTRRRHWLDDKVDVRSQTANKRMRLAMADGTAALVEFTAKGNARSVATVQHTKLPNRATASKMRAWWQDRFDALAEALK